MSEQFSIVFSYLGNGASIVGLGLTLWIAYSLKRIRKYLFLTSSLPKKLVELANLRYEFGEHKNLEEAKNKIRQIKGILERLVPHLLDPDTRKRIEDNCSDLSRGLGFRHLSDDQLEEIRGCLLDSEGTLEDYVNTIPWRSA